MKYISTRSNASARKFCDILLEGLAPDGGLYMPESYPQINQKQLEELKNTYFTKGYAALAYEILSLYIDDIPARDLKQICEKTYTKTAFGTQEIVPLKELDAGNFYIEELSNGPTLAFKDMAMQLLGNLFEYELQRRGQELNILGATSGDTGSAAEYAMRGKKGIKVYMLSPHGRMSAFQQAQMFSLMDENIINIAVEGVFDDCQDIVKQVSADIEFKQKHKIGTVNSINWARLLAQVVYYFAGYFQASQKSGAKQISFTVPSGNFGNVCAGHIARQMGLPIEKLIVATNENDVLNEFFKTGIYRVRNSEQTYETSSPSMDISKASNFERFIFDYLNRDDQKCKELFVDELNKNASFDINKINNNNPDKYPAFEAIKTKYGFSSGKSTHQNRLETIKATHEKYKITIDPHTADAVYVAREYQDKSTPMVALETALPIKFSETIKEALGKEPERPAKFEGIENLPKRVKVIKADAQEIKKLISQQ